MRKCVYAGSFDPVTKGHEDIIRKAALTFDEVVVAICHNPDKSYAFSEELRVEMLEKTCKKYTNVRIVRHEGMLVDLLKKENTVYNVRGIRNATDLDYENEMRFYNENLMPEIITVYFPCEDKNAHISSSAVKQLLRLGKSADEFLPEEIKGILK
ncbi:MAG: pantetheine-phosphate adenylyltransferase [Clostridia bacterium]|nr:pantetheine-phosphate adenylyltransferase [Clostridia bacterium]